MAKKAAPSLSENEKTELIKILKVRFEKNKKRHPNVIWADVEARLNKTDKLWSLQEMEDTGGEPDVVDFDAKTGEFVFFDCAAESPKGRRSLCYDQKALDDRKEYKPVDSALGMAAAMGINILNPAQYSFLQTLGKFDTKTSSWVETPAAIRKLDGAMFGDCRYDTVWFYHNGAQSYYAARGFRGCLRV